MPHRWPKAVLFDFDGVLVNSEPLHFRAFAEVLAAEGISLSEDDYYTHGIGFDDKGTIRNIFAAQGKDLDPRTMLRVQTRKREAMMDLIERRTYQALPGVEAFVRSLWRRCPLAIVSGALRDEIEVMLDGIRLRDCFRVIVAAEDVTVGKPDPAGYLMAMKMLADEAGKTFTPKDCLIVEDAASVIRNVRAVGFTALGVAGSGSAMDLQQAGADAVVKSLRMDDVSAALPELKLEPS